MPIDCFIVSRLFSKERTPRAGRRETAYRRWVENLLCEHIRGAPSAFCAKQTANGEHGVNPQRQDSTAAQLAD
jgi:hypothetical protein